MTKINCPECLRGNHFRCRDAETCLCAETKEHIDDLKNSKVSPKTYTESGLCDALKHEINSDRLLTATVDTLWSVKFPTLRWDPTEYKDTFDEFFNNESKYRIALRRAVREVAAQRRPWMNLEDSIEFINNCKIEFTDSKSIKMSEWGPQHSGVPLATDCVILSLEDRETYTKSAKAECVGCNTLIDLEIDPFSRRMQPPPKCDKEDCSHYDQRLAVNPKHHVTEYCQKMLIQEPMEEAKHGTPTIFECEIYGSDVYHAFIGQRKRLIGVFTSEEVKRQSTHKIIIRSVSMSEGSNTVPLMPEQGQIEIWMAMAKDSESFLDMLVKSYAPELYKDEQTKLAVLTVLMSLVRGTTIDRLRGDIHTILVGDPSLGKTKILEFMILITQKSAYVNGRMASGPGMTVGMDQTAGGKRVPRVGPIPLCTDGFVGIDEMGRMKTGDLTALHESMESGHITFTKAGYNFMVDARTTIIGAANPTADVWDDALNMIDNIGLPRTILSRADFLVNLRDQKNDIEDQNKMQHILKMRRGDKLEGILSIDEFTKLLNYVRLISPKMLKESEKMISNFFYALRKIDQPAGSRQADTRLSESLIRISTAIAKLHFSDEVKPEHVDLALELVKKSFHTVGMKVEEGQTISDSEGLITKPEHAILKCARKLEAVAKDGKFPYSDLIDMVIEKEPEQFPEGREQVEKWIDNNMDRASDPMFLRSGVDLRLSGRMTAK